MAWGVTWSRAYGNTGPDHQLWLGIRWESNVINSTTSRVNVRLVLQCSILYTSATGTNVLNVDGGSYPFSIDISKSNISEILLKEVTVTVDHNSNGDRSVPISGTWTMNGDYAGEWISSISVSTTAVLDKINTTPGTPTSASLTGAYEKGSSVSITPYGATGTVTGYDYQLRVWHPTTGWSPWGEGASTYPITNVLGYLIQGRVRAKNGSYVSGWRETNTLEHFGIKVYDGGKFKVGNIKVFNGTDWVKGYVQIYDGTSWKLCQ